MVARQVPVPTRKHWGQQHHVGIQGDGRVRGNPSSGSLHPVNEGVLVIDNGTARLQIFRVNVLRPHVHSRRNSPKAWGITRIPARHDGLFFPITYTTVFLQQIRKQIKNEFLYTSYRIIHSFFLATL